MPLYLSFIGNKREVKIKTLISFEGLTIQPATSRSPSSETRESMKTLKFFLFAFYSFIILIYLKSIETEDIEFYEA